MNFGKKNNVAAVRFVETSAAENFEKMENMIQFSESMTRLFRKNSRK